MGFILNGGQATRRKRKMQPERGAALRFLPSLLPCSGRTIQRSRRLSGTCRSINRHAREREILALSRLSAGHGAAKPRRRPLQPVPPRRMIATADGLDDPAQQAGLQISSPSATGSRPVDGRRRLPARRRAVSTRRRGQSVARAPAAAADRRPAPGRRCRLAQRARARSAGRRSTDRRSTPTPRAISVAVSRDSRHAEQRPQQPDLGDARQPPPCRPDRRARSAAPRAWPRSRPGRRHGAPAADAGCRAGGTRRAAAGSGRRAPPPAARCAAWPRPSAGSRPRNADAVRAGRASSAASAADSGRSAMVDDQRQRPARRAPPPSRAPAAPGRANRARRRRRRRRRACASNGSNGAISRANVPATSRGRPSARRSVTRSRSSGAPGRRGASAGRWRADSPG